MAKEEWRAVPGYEGHYEVSSRGRVRSLTRRVRRSKNGDMLKQGHVLSPFVGNHRGILRRTLSLYKDGKGRPRPVASLVLLTFVGPRPAGHHCCHNNGNALDDRLENLRYDTVKGNQADRYKHETYLAGEDHHNSKLTLDQVLEMRRIYAMGGTSYATLAKKYRVDWVTIQDVIKRRTWHYDDAGNFLPPDKRPVLPKENNRTKQARKYKALGMSKTLKEWEAYTGIAFATIDARIKSGWSVKTAVTKPVRGTK